MARRFFRRFLPTHETMKNDRLLKRFAHLLHQPSLWHLNRHSVARGVGVGMFWAWIPLPIQSPFAIACAMKIRGNVPLAYVCTWISNPLTLVPSVYICYQIGAFFTGQPTVGSVVHDITSQPGWREMLAYMRDHWTVVWPFFPGCVIFSTMWGLGSFFGVHALWRWNLVRRMNRRVERLKHNAIVVTESMRKSQNATT